jgi:alkylation response protein AidB-like acyl-CoA dehydrogenase
VIAATAMEALLEDTLRNTKERKAFGRPIGSRQNSRFLLAELPAAARRLRLYA